jgi:hypothetical protein
MFTKSKILLAVAMICTASAASALDRNSGTNGGSLAMQRQTVLSNPSARAARAQVRGRSDFEGIWFRQAEGPEWN